MLQSFAGYEPTIDSPDVYPQYFDPTTGKFTPLSKVQLEPYEAHEVYQVLDSITLALEAGAVSEKHWLRELFGTPDAFEEFLEEFETYDECFRISDRWHAALALLGDSLLDHADFITCEDIADRLRDVARESGQL